ncbi:hypothetical protein ACMD2_23199 [Ananas comosus]|uniref:DUF868 domain-containing protein n=1 Tax=Ananas comosus TaxID=4615 RepID=A0A199VKL0_ANACO|nr:hypothetical protein ACMD2_23199 [Ananas comosus]
MEDQTANPTSSSSADKTATDEPTGSNGNGNNNNNNNKTAQCSVVSIYRAKIAGVLRHVTVAWTKSLINHSFAISVELPEGGASTCKVELKPWPFWSKKGYKSLDVADDDEECRVDVFWDLRSAKFSGSGSPEPTAGYYVALVCDEEVILLVGDGNKDAYKRTKSRPCLEDAVLVSKRENVFGRKSFAARARFDGRKKEHDIVVESAISGPREPEMWISIDGAVLVRVSNLQWKFRGNETVIVDESPVQVLWDVHDWLFAGGPGSSSGLFVFKPGAPDPQPQPQPPSKQEHFGESDHASTVGTNTDTDKNNCSSSSVRNFGGNSEFCFYLYAWKIE